MPYSKLHVAALASACMLFPSKVVVTANMMQVSSDPAVALKASMFMDAQAPMTGNPDHDFAVQMSAHHWVSLDLLQKQVLSAELSMSPKGWWPVTCCGASRGTSMCRASA